MNKIISKEFKLNDRVLLSIIDIDDLDNDFIKILDDNFVSICEGNSGSKLEIVKKRVVDLFSTKNYDWILGATAEFFIHLYIRTNGYKQECMYLNLEENSIKKGFDGFYSRNNETWLMESKAGSIDSKNVTHSGKVILAMNDLTKKVSGKDKTGKREKPNNPWQEAYAHAGHCDIGTAKEIRYSLKTLADNFVIGKYKTIDEFNTMPCGTVFLSGTWKQFDHENIKETINQLEHKLLGKQVHVICVTNKSVKLFINYINGRINNESK